MKMLRSPDPIRMSVLPWLVECLICRLPLVVAVQLNQEVRPDTFFVEAVECLRAALHHLHHPLDHGKDVLVFGLSSTGSGLYGAVVAGGSFGASFRLTFGAGQSQYVTAPRRSRLLGVAVCCGRGARFTLSKAPSGAIITPISTGNPVNVG